MSKPPLVSILIPAYNAGKTIHECVESALRQTWQNVEVVVVEDGSSDETMTVLEGFKADNLHVYQQKNSGASSARNHALKMSKGVYIQYLDADDTIAPDKIEKQIKVLQSHPGSVATGSWGRFHDKPANAEFRKQPPWRDFERAADFLRLLYQDHYMMHPACWLVPRDVADAAGPWDERLSLDDDGEYFARVVLASTGIRFVEEARSYYRSGNPGSLSNLRGEKAWRSQFLSMELSTRYLLDVDDSQETRKAVANRYQRFVYQCWPDMLELVRDAEDRVNELGGADLEPVLGGRVVNCMSRMVGWRLAKRLRLATRQFMRLEKVR